MLTMLMMGTDEGADDRENYINKLPNSRSTAPRAPILYNLRELGLALLTSSWGLARFWGLVSNKMSSPVAARFGKLQWRRAVPTIGVYEIGICAKSTPFLDL